MEIPVITIDPEIMHGVPCFAGTRVTLQTFIDHIVSGYTIDEFLVQFPSVKREQVLRLLNSLSQKSNSD